MGVHSLHVFDRRGSTLFTKRYGKAQPGQSVDEEQLSEQRKLVFGMLFSLREMVGSLAPENKGKDPGLHSVRTGAGTLHNFETISGIRFALYTSNTSDQSQAAIRSALKHIYTNIWVDCVVRSPLYKSSMEGTMDVSSTNFEATLDAYLQGMTWFL